MAEQRRPGRCPAEMRDRAVRMVFEAEASTGSQWEAVRSVSSKIGDDVRDVASVGSPGRVDEGRRGGVTTDERERLKQLERENRELRRAYLAIRYTERLPQNGVANSVGSRGNSHDNALAETIIRLYKTELVRASG